MRISFDVKLSLTEKTSLLSMNFRFKIKKKISKLYRFLDHFLVGTVLVGLVCSSQVIEVSASSPVLEFVFRQQFLKAEVECQIK